MASNTYRDTTIDPAKARHQQVVWHNRVKKLAKKTDFDEYELQALCLIFHKICEAHEWWGCEVRKDRVDRLDRLGFRDGVSVLLDMYDAESLDGLFSGLDPDSKRYVTVGRWIQALSAIKGSSAGAGRALPLCWQAYHKGDAVGLTRSDMTTHARKMFVDAGIDNFDYFCKEFVDIMLKDTKAGKEGFLPMSEYLDIVSRRPLFNEFLLTVLPSRHALDTFFATFRPERPPKRRRASASGPVSSQAVKAPASASASASVSVSSSARAWAKVRGKLYQITQQK